MAFNHKYNTDDSIIRANIVGLVNEMNNRIFFENVWQDNKKQVVRVPFFYAMSGDERFLQDYFSNWSECAPDFIEGNTDPIPRGTLFLSGYSVLAGNLTSRYVRGYYTKEVDGQLKRFNSYINSIPIQLNFTGEILVDTSIDSFKIVQAITAYLYRTQTYSVNFKGFRVPTNVGFPDSYNIGKQFEFTYGNTERIKVTFDVEVQSYLPVVDDQNEFFGGQQVSGFQANFGASFAGATGSGQNTVTGTNQAAQSTINNTVNNPQNSQSTSITPAAPAAPGQVGGSLQGGSQTLTDQNNYVTPPDLAQSGNIDVGSTTSSGKVKDSNNNNTTEDESRNDNNGFKTDDGEYDGNYWE
jgi:hypothetical protein